MMKQLLLHLYCHSGQMITDFIVWQGMSMNGSRMFTGHCLLLISVTSAHTGEMFFRLSKEILQPVRLLKKISMENLSTGISISATFRNIPRTTGKQITRTILMEIFTPACSTLQKQNLTLLLWSQNKCTHSISRI